MLFRWKDRGSAARGPRLSGPVHQPYAGVRKFWSRDAFLISGVDDLMKSRDYRMVGQFDDRVMTSVRATPKTRSRFGSWSDVSCTRILYSPLPLPVGSSSAGRGVRLYAWFTKERGEEPIVSRTYCFSTGARSTNSKSWLRHCGFGVSSATMSTPSAARIRRFLRSIRHRNPD